MFIYFRLDPSYCLLQEKWRKGWRLQRGQIYLHQHCKLSNIALVLVFPWRGHCKGFSRRERIGSKQHRHIKKFTVLERRKIILSSFYKILLCRKQIPWGELVCAKRLNIGMVFSMEAPKITKWISNMAQDSRSIFSLYL